MPAGKQETAMGTGTATSTAVVAGVEVDTQPTLLAGAAPGARS